MTLQEHVSSFDCNISGWISQYLHGIHGLGHVGSVEALNGKRPRDRPYPVEVLPAGDQGSAHAIEQEMLGGGCLPSRRRRHLLVVSYSFVYSQNQNERKDRKQERNNVDVVGIGRR